MPEHEIRGGELWLFADEMVIAEVLPTANQLRLVTTRASGLIYASTFVLSTDHGYRYDVPQWRQGKLNRSILENVEQATIAISAAIADAE
jgi:hypothetical protein